MNSYSPKKGYISHLTLFKNSSRINFGLTPHSMILQGVSICQTKIQKTRQKLKKNRKYFILLVQAGSNDEKKLEVENLLGKLIT